MALIFLLMSLMFAVLFYFIDIFILIVVGMLLIIVTERVGGEFDRRMDERKYPPRNRKAIMCGQVFLLAFIIFLFTFGQITDVSNLIVEVESHRNIETTLLLEYDKYVAQALGSRIITDGNINAIMKYFTSSLSALLSAVAYYVFTAVLIIPLMFTTYFHGKDEILKSVFDSVPHKYQKEFVKATKEIGRQLNDFITAKLIESVIVGGICCIGFYLAGVKGWLFLGTIAGVMNIIPYIGPIMGAIPSIFIGYLTSPLTAILALATNVIAQIIDEYYLVPFVIPNKVKMDPLWSLILILIGAKIYGIEGILFVIPVYIVYKIVLINSYHELTTIYPEKQIQLEPQISKSPSITNGVKPDSTPDDSSRLTNLQKNDAINMLRVRPKKTENVLKANG